jgi:hypothetical protein
MARKQLSDMVSDIRAGLELGMEKATRDLVQELQEQGPHWTGEFEANWKVVPGQRLMSSGNPGGPVNFDRPEERGAPPTIAVPMTTLEQGYTVYNDMEYADKAMDLEPGDDGIYRGDRLRATAPRDWFEKYILGGPANLTLANGVKDGMKIAGF